MGDVLVELRELCIGYGRALLPPLSLELRRGELWGIVGPNGAGKTTFARTILGLLPPVSGQVLHPKGRVRASYTPQRHRLAPGYPLTAFEIVLMGRTAYLPLGRRAGTDDRRRASEELERLGIGVFSKKLFRELSGGQQQRVLLARALAADPDLLVLDEPAEGMDLLGTHDILAFLSSFDQGKRMAVLMISHSLDDVLAVVDHLCFVNQFTGQFEAGEAERMASPEKLSGLYGRAVESHTCAGKTHVHVREG